MNAIGIDYGEARMGVAGSDALGFLAHPVETVPGRPWPEAAKRIGEITRARKAETVVMGLPVREDGTEGTAAEKVRKFAELLQTHLPPGTALVFQDEYRSTMTATENLRASGKRTKGHRPVIDQAAAAVILQDWLDARQPPGEALEG